MSADTRKKIYDILKNKTGFMDSYEDFDNDMTTSEYARKKVYEVLRDKTGFNDTYENFVSGISGEVQKESNIPTVKEESGNVVTTVQSPSYPQRAETKERILNNIPDYFRSRGNDLSTLPLPQNTMSAEKPADIPGRIVQDEQQRIQLAERSANDPYMKQQELEYVFKPKNQEQIDSVRQLINSARQQRVKERQQRVKSAGGGGIFSTMSQAYLSGEQNDADKQLEYASTLIEQSQNITNEAKKKGNTNFFSGFARGFKDAPLDGWAMGLQDLKNYSAAKKVMDKVDRGEELSPSEDALMQALVTNAATQMYYSGDLGRGYKAGGVTAESLPFMLDMIAGMGTIQSVTKPASKALVKYATEKAAKMGLGRATTGLAKGAARTAAGLGDVAAHTATFGGARVAADYQRRGLGDVQVSPEQDGTVSYAGRDNVQTGAEAIGKSVVSTAAETGSELLGEYFAPMLGWVGKVTGANRLGKIIPASVGKAYSSIINSNGFKQVQEIARRAKIADPIGEYGEEVVNNLVSTAIGDMTPEQLVDLDNNIDTFLGVAPMSALFGAAGTGKYVVNKFANYRNMKRFEEEMRETMGDDWSGVREALQDADIETAREMVKDVLRSGMQSDMKQKAIKYIATVLQEQTLQQVDMQMAPEQIVNEKKSIFKNLSDARKKINLTDEQLEEALYSSDLSMYDEQTERSIEEYRQAYNDYLNYTYWVQDQAYVARREAESQVERMTNATTGTVMRVKSGLSQNPVNILRGNIVFDAEGNVDKDSSDNTIYYLSEDGKVKMAPISMFESLVDDTPAEELAYQAGEDAEQEFIHNEEAQIMQPEQSVQPIELGTTFQKDGVTYVVSQKSPDGYVVSALDEEGNPVQSKLLTEEQIRTAMTPAIQEEQTSQEQFAQSEDVTQPEQQQVQTEPQTAISRIPVNENGEHDFESAPYQDTSSALIEISENVDDAKDTATQMINHYQEELKKADKAKTTGNTIQEIVRLKQQKKANIQSINDKIAYWNSVANDIESKRPGGIIEQAKEESDANQQRLSEMTAEQQQAAQQEVQKKIDSGSYERKEPRKRARYVNEDNEMGTANTPMEHVLREIATGRVTFNWNDSGETQGLGSHLGLASSPEERRRMIWALSSDGMTPEAAAEQIHADMPETLQGMVTDQDVFNMILESFQQYGTPSKMWEAAKSMHGTDIEESAPGYEDYMEQQALEWEASQNNMTVEEWISYVDYVEEELDNMYSSVSDEDLNAIFEKFNEQIISENESRGNETESAGSTEGQTDGEQGDELLPEGRGNNEGADTTVNEQPEPANQADGESGGVVPESEGAVKTEIESARKEVDQNPTEAQKEAGNYKKGHVKVDGFDITIENPKGSVRSGKDADGKEWSVTMNNDYGYIRGTEGVDGDHIDVFLSDNPEQGNVYVIDQVNQKTGEYDESKVMYGFNSLEEAKDAYLANFEEGWKVGVVSGVSKEEFRKWIESSVRKTKPFSEYKSVKVEEAQNEGIRPDEGVLDYAKRVAEREQKKAKPEKKIDVFSYTDAKSNIPAYRGAYYSDGTVTATNGFTLIRLQATYPSENEGKVISKKGEDVENVRYPKVELIIPKGEQEEVTVDKESVRAKLNEIETKLKEEWEKSDKKTPYKTLKAITTVKVNIGGVTHNMSLDRLSALLDGMDAIGSNQVGITKTLAYAKNGKQLIAVAFNAKDIDDTYDNLSISDETYSEDTINQMKRVGVPLTDLEGIPKSEDGMFQIYGIQNVVGETMYFVSSPGKTVKNMDENYVGTGDRMFKSLDEAIKGAEEERASYQRTKADREEREERVRQRIEEERKAQEAKDATPLGKFLKTLNRLQAGKADGILSDNVSFNGETMSKADFIQRVIADGYAAEEYLDGTKIKYRLVKDGKGYKINKTEFDFAKFAGAGTIEVENKDDLINLERLSRKYADKGVYTMADIDKRIDSTERRLKGTNENGKEGKELKKALEELNELKRLKEMQNSTRTKQEENVESQNTSDEQTNESGLTDSNVEQERTSPKERIEDTGEKIGGARKDIIRKYADKINLSAQTFSKMFPKPDIKALVEAGVPIKDAAAVKAMYDIAKAEYKRRKSTANSVFFAMYAKQVLSGDRSKELVYNGVVFTEYGKEIITANEKAYAALYERLGLEYSDIDLYDFRIIPRSGFDTRIINFNELNRQNQELSKRRGKNVKYLDGDKVNFVIGPYHRAENQFETIEDAIDAFVERVKKETKLDAPKYSPSIYWKKKDGYTDYSTTWVGTKIKGFGLVDVKSFKNSSEARKWLAEHQEDFQQMSAAEESRLNEEKKEGVASYTQIIEKEVNAFVVKIKVRGIGQPIEVKRFPIEGERYSRERSLNYKKMMDESSQWAKSEECKQISDEIAQNALSAKKGKVKIKTETDKMRERVGEDYRSGRDITTNELLDTFGFRAIEFGNYVSQKERQSFLNNIYDSLMDMSKILGISPKGLSLGGKLAIAYGARGKSAASGHYEPYKNVINVTKTSGNGVFAHEWMHALDYYFSNFNPENIYSSAPHATSGEYKSDIRDEVKSSFDNLMSVIKASDYYKRSVALNEYYSSDTELAARALQDYIIRKLEERGQVNDFLSNHITPEEWSGSEKTYPFPSGKEVETIGEAFNNLFDTIDEKVDEEGNTTLFREEGNPDTRFRFIGEQGAANLDAAEEANTRLDNLAVAREMEKSGKDAKSIKISTGWERGSDGKWRYEEEDFEYIPKGNAREKSLLEREPWHKELMSLSDKVYNGEKLSNEEEVRFDELSKKETELKDSLKKSDIKFLDDYVSDNTLFKEYPELKQVKVEFYDGSFFDGGSYSHHDMTIRINNNSPLDAKSILVHEVQHAIQHIEGFSRGGNSRTYRNYLNSLKEKRDAWSMIDEFEEKSKELGSDASKMDVYKAVRDEYTSLGMSFGDGIMPSRDAFDEGFNLWVRGYDKEGYEDAYKEYQNLIEKFGLGESKDRYHELSGEVEARNVQSRLNMTPEERRSTLASETEDVAREDQIFLYDSMGANSITINENQDLNNIKSEDVEETSKKLNVPVEVITSVDQIKDNSVRSAIEKGRKVKGWYSLSDNKVYVYLPNATSMEDVNQTILHEGVAHYGLRQLVGEDRMDDFLDDVFANVTDEVRKKIIDTLPGYGYNSRIATEEYMARMAENGVDVSVWQRIKQAFNSLMRRMGINIKISDNELRYILWRSRQNLDKNKPLDLAKDVAMQYQMGVGNYFREVDQTPEQSIIDAWDNIASSTMFSLRESTVDYLTAIDKFQDLISKRTGEEIKSFENAYDSMTFLSSKNRVEMDWYDSNIVTPIRKAILKLVGKQKGRKWDWNKGELRKLVMYVEAKHGAERNRQMAIEKYIKELKPESLKLFENAGISIDRDKYKEDLKKAKEEAGKKAYDKSFQSIYDKLINEGLQKEEAESQAKKRAKVIADRAKSNASEKFRNDFRDKLMKEYSEKVMSDWNDTKKRISKQKDISWIEKQRELDREASRIGADLSQDYSGLSSVFGDEKEYPDGWYESSLNFVEEYENNHNETSIGDLWKSISQATDYTLNKQYESGLVSREYVDRQKQRFENYIPLRGFQDEIAGDVYNYIGNDFYPGSNPVKSAKGRTSEAGNPFGSILNTGYSTISVGNKNLAKMSLYSLVNNHDTEGLAVSNRAWMVRYDRLMQDDDLRETLVIPKLESGEDVPEWVEAVPKYPEGDIPAEEVSRILGRFEDLMKKNNKEGYAKPVSKKSRIAYRTLYNERSEHEIPLYILGDKYVITLTGNPRVAQAMNGLLNPNVNNKGWAEIGERIQRFMAGAFTAKNAAFSIANLIKDTMYSNNQVFIKENVLYWIKFTKNQKAGFGDFVPMMIRLKKYQDGNLDLSDKINKMFKEFMDNGGATGYTFVDTQENYAKDLAEKLKDLSRKNKSLIDPRKITKIFFDCVEFTGQAAELVNRFAAYKTSRDMGRSVTRSIRDAKEITVNFNRKGAGMKSWNDNKSLFDVTNMAAFFSQYGRAYILFWNANMQAKYRFYKNIKENTVKTSTTLIANSMMFASFLIPFMNNFVLPSLYEMFGIGSGDDDEDYYNTLTDWERTHNICVRLPKGNWLKIPVSPEMSPWYTMGDCIGGAISGQRDLSATDFIKSGIDAISPLSINWSYEGANVLLNVLPTISQPVAQVAMNVNFMGNPIKKQPFTIRQGFSPQYKMVYGNTSPALIELSRLSNKLTGGTDGKTSGSLDWNPSLWQNIITGYTGGYGSSFLSAADWIVSTSKGEEQSSAIGKMPLVSRFFISGNKDVKMRRINSSFYDVIKFTEEFKFDQKSLEDEITSSYKEGNTLSSEESRKKLEELLRSDRARKYIELENIVNSVNDIEKYMKEMPDDETTQAILYQLKTKGIDILKK